MTATNCITGHPIKSRVNSKKFSDNWDNIFKKKDTEEDKKLNPCKNCGSEDLEFACATAGHSTLDYVVCRNCKHEGSGDTFGQEEAIKAWNSQNPQ